MSDGRLRANTSPLAHSIQRTLGIRRQVTAVVAKSSRSYSEAPQCRTLCRYSERVVSLSWSVIRLFNSGPHHSGYRRLSNASKGKLDGTLRMC